MNNTGNINWGVRFKNPVFWVQVAASIVLPLVIGIGYAWEDMTSWNTLFDAIVAGASNPVVFVAMLASLWATINDPTTSGISDSLSALTRTTVKPNAKKESKEA